MAWYLRISVRMAILVGLAFPGLASVLGIYLIADSRVADLRTQAEAFNNNVRERGAAIRLDAFDMRRREKDFLLRNDENFASQYRDAEKKVENELQKMRAAPAAQPVASHLDGLIAGVARHAAEFDMVVKAQESIGFDQNKGALAALRQAVHDVEAKVNALGRSDLLASMLMMRRHEKDFLLREDKKYLDEAIQERGRFDQIAEKSGTPQESLAEIKPLLDAYVKNLTVLVDLRLTSNEHIAQLSKIFAEMQPAFEAVFAFAEEGAAKADQAALEMREWSRTTC